jgi:hypothetical protein
MIRTRSPILIGILLGLCHHALVAQRADTAVVLAWKFPPGTVYALELTDSVHSGSDGSGVELRDRTELIFRGEAEGADGFRIRVVRRNWFGLSIDHGRHWTAEQETGGTDSVGLTMTPSGRLTPREQGVRLSAGAVIEDLAGALPFTLPTLAVRPGETWPIVQRGVRKNRMFGEMSFELQGEATLDSIIGDRAYVSVRASSHDETDRTEGRDSTLAHVTWEISTGRPLTVEQSSEFDWIRGGAPGNPSVKTKSAARLLPGSPAPPTAGTP